MTVRSTNVEAGCCTEITMGGIFEKCAFNEYLFASYNFISGVLERYSSSINKYGFLTLGKPTWRVSASAYLV